jgi:tetratricopeptide (TPR) repeat protein
MSEFVELSSDLEILVIDEAQTFRESLSTLLKTMGFKKITGTSEGLSGLQIMKERDIGFVICEKNLRQMSGMELLREIRETPELRRVPFLMMCSEIPKEDVILASEFGLDGYLKKPFAMKDVSTRIASCMARFRDESNTEYLFECARENYSKGDFKLANSFYDQLLQALPKSARVRVGMARCFHGLKDFNSAEAKLKEAIQLNGLYVHAHHELGLLYLTKGNLDSGMQCFDKAIQLSPSNPVRYETIASILMSQGKFEMAEEYLLKAVKLELVYPVLYSQLGKALFSQKKLDKAVKFFEKALEREPDNTSFLNSIGICLKELGRYEDAISHYNRALKHRPQDTKILFNKVLCLCHMEEFERSKKILLQILKIDPNYDKAKQKIAEIDRSAKVVADKAS